MENFTLILQHLTTWTEEHQLVQRAVTACHSALANAQQDDISADVIPLNGWSIEAIQVQFARHAFIFQHKHFLAPFIETKLDLWVDDSAGVPAIGQRVIGTYRLITTLTGEIDDDYLEFI